MYCGKKTILSHYIEEGGANHCPNLWTHTVTLTDTGYQRLPLLAVLTPAGIMEHHADMMI